MDADQRRWGMNEALLEQRGFRPEGERFDLVGFDWSSGTAGSGVPALPAYPLHGALIAGDFVNAVSGN